MNYILFYSYLMIKILEWYIFINKNVLAQKHTLLITYKILAKKCGKFSYICSNRLIPQFIVIY